MGYWSRGRYFRVVGYTKSGAPRVEELEKHIVSHTSTPADSDTVHELAQPITVRPGGAQYAARWSDKEACWRLSIVFNHYGEPDKIKLRDWVPGEQIHEPTFG